ncbi:glycerol-3-phosphate acyltransferase [Alicyclobacillus sp. ALC3]|uniref:glycerol-3-phosphate acyltransferase n=1 Tax=Alicyclobacillus sp. ALC3 TaxID=2796143 RepID=UPI002379169C|nr:glycerol-3-phosphate acyltransferase [Alicyclobacillus sp. ALC3]WDL97670.1 glycerol-3-phosphate acyltransferase [Alicyclobacillus sp. ALC3]
MTVVLTCICLLSGSLMFSYWLGLLAKVNLRGVGDGNPGAFNLWRGAGFKLGLLGVALDFVKGYLPIFLILHAGLASGYQLVAIALAPVIGHAFSPFLRFKGGKSLAVTFGVWSALTMFRASICFAIILALMFLVVRVHKGKAATSTEDGMQTTFGFLLLSLYLLIAKSPTAFFWIWLGNFLILLWKSRDAAAALFKGKTTPAR